MRDGVEAVIIATEDDEFFTSLLLTPAAFERFCRELEAAAPVDMIRGRVVGPSLMKKVRRLGCLPMIQRTPRTQALFEKYGVITTLLCGMITPLGHQAYSGADSEAQPSQQEKQ